jgi:hypothetical protein
MPRIAGSWPTCSARGAAPGSGGPILFVTDITDARQALPSARAEAERLGSPVIVVDQRPADKELGFVLDNAGFYRHCDFLAGTII